MNIEEIRSHREILEMKIFTLLNEFKSQTGLSIVGCEIRSIRTQLLRLPTPEIFVSSVSLEVESV